MKEKILDALRALGFELDDTGDVGFGFNYEGKHYLYLYNENDEDFLNISLPAVLSIDDDDNMDVYKIMDFLNSSLKYVKAYKIKDSVWLFYERELFGGEDLKQLLSHMILHLEAGITFLRRTTSSSDDASDGVPDVPYYDAGSDDNNADS